MLWTMLECKILVTLHLSDIDRVLESDVPEEVEQTLQGVVVLGCSIFSSSPDDIVRLNLKEFES